MRERDTRRVIFELANTGPGDAVLFRISEKLEHMVTAVEGDEPRTVFAGWFSRTPGFHHHPVLKPLAGTRRGADGHRPPLPHQLRPAADVAFHPVGGDLFLHRLAPDAFIRLGPTGRRIWERVLTCPDMHAIVSALSAEYDAPFSEVERDTRRLLEEFFALGLVEAAP